MLYRLPNGKLAVENRDSLDGEMKTKVEGAGYFGQVEYDPEHALHVQRVYENKERQQAADKAFKKAQHEAELRRMFMETRRLQAQAAKLERPMPTLQELQIKNELIRQKNLGEYYGDFGPVSELRSDEDVRRDTYAVTPVEHFGEGDYWVQDYNWQNNPNYTQFRTKYASNVKPMANIKAQLSDFVQNYVEGIDDINDNGQIVARPEHLTLMQEQKNNEFNVTPEKMVEQIPTSTSATKSKAPLWIGALIALVAALS